MLSNMFKSSSRITQDRLTQFGIVSIRQQQCAVGSVFPKLRAAWQGTISTKPFSASAGTWTSSHHRGAEKLHTLNIIRFLLRAYFRRLESRKYLQL